MAEQKDAGKAIYLLVSERSGSNLFRSLLDNHSGIAAPVAPHLMNQFYPVRAYYGDLREPGNGSLLFRDMAKVADHFYHDWQLGTEAVEAKLQDNGPPRSVVEAVDLLYRTKAEKEGKAHYASKGLHNVHFLDAIRAELPDATFLHLVRDPRDHVASWMKRPVNIFAPYDAIRKWVREQRLFLDALYRRGVEAVSLRYEDLIGDTASTMAFVLEELELPVDRACFDTDPEKGKALNWNPHWKNLSQPVMGDNKGKYKEELDEEDIRMIETIAGDVMKAFGYSFETSADWRYHRAYGKKLKAQREQGKARAKGVREENEGNLDAKLRFVQGLLRDRYEEALERGERDLPSPYGAVSRDSLFDRLFRNRFHYLMKAFLGERVPDLSTSPSRKQKEAHNP